MKTTLVLDSIVRDALLRVRKQQDIPPGEPMRLGQTEVATAVRYAIVAALGLDDDQAAELKTLWPDLCKAGFVGNASQFRQACNGLPESDDLWQPKKAAASVEQYD